MTRFKVIKGTFHVRGYAPDGDSIRFQAERPEHWDFFSWTSAAARNRKKKQLRIEAVDALETHYNGFRQPGAFALAALEEMLALLDIHIEAYNLSLSKIMRARDGTPGFIAASKLDVYERPVSFVFQDSDSLSDGLELTAEELPYRESINYRLMKRGLVYPTFYKGLDDSLLQAFREVTRRARRASRGLWAIDRTRGFTLWDRKTIQEDVLIMPKLFRRFVSFFRYRSDIKVFKNLLKDNREKVLLLPDGTPSSMDEIVAIDGNHYGLTVNPEDILFLP